LAAEDDVGAAAVGVHHTQAARRRERDRAAVRRPDGAVELPGWKLDRCEETLRGVTRRVRGVERSVADVRDPSAVGRPRRERPVQRGDDPAVACDDLRQRPALDEELVAARTPAADDARQEAVLAAVADRDERGGGSARVEGEEAGVGGPGRPGIVPERRRTGGTRELA